MNTFRTPEYIKLKHSIRSCTNSAQLETLRETILRTAPELMAEFIAKSAELNEPLHKLVP